MKIFEEIGLVDFNAWSGAIDTKDKILEAGKQDEFDAFIEEAYPDGMSDTELNDLLWFQDEWIFEMLGMDTEEEE